MIGDNLETDILGANNFGIHSMLIASGVHELVNPNKGGILKGELNELQKILKVDISKIINLMKPLIIVFQEQLLVEMYRCI